MINNSVDYFQIHKMIDDIQPDFPLISNEEDALKYLYFLDQTSADSSSAFNIIDYELLIYLELYFKQNEKIQQLIMNIKSNVFHDFITKHKYIKRLTDDLCKRNLPKLLSSNLRFKSLNIEKEDKK